MGRRLSALKEVTHADLELLHYYTACEKHGPSRVFGSLFGFGPNNPGTRSSAPFLFGRVINDQTDADICFRYLFVSDGPTSPQGIWNSLILGSHARRYLLTGSKAQGFFEHVFGWTVYWIRIEQNEEQRQKVEDVVFGHRRNGVICHVGRAKLLAVLVRSNGGEIKSLLYSKAYFDWLSRASRSGRTRQPCSVWSFCRLLAQTYGVESIRKVRASGHPSSSPDALPICHMQLFPAVREWPALLSSLSSANAHSLSGDPLRCCPKATAYWVSG